MPQYSDYILVSGTTETIKKNTKGSRYVVSDDGVLVISSGGTLQWSDSTDHYILYGGKVYVCSGGTACGGTYLVSGSCYVYAGGIASSPEISDSSWFVVSSGGKVYNAQISSGGIMDVKSSGFAYFTTVSGGAMYVYHYASTTFVYSGGIVRVSSGATLIDTTVNRDGAVTVSSGGTALSTYIYPGASAALYGIAYYNHISSGRMSVMSGGYANTNDVKSGVLDVFSGGTVTSNQITSGGVMNVSKGGLASKTTIFMYGSAYIGGTASGTVMSGGWMDLFGSSYNGVYSSGVVSIGYGGYSYNEVFSNTRTYVLSSGSGSGVVYGGTVGSGCSVIVSGGRFGGKTVSNAVFDVTGGNVDVSGVNGAKAWISGGVFFASGGVMSSATVMPLGSAMGKMYVFSGTTATKVNISPNGHLGIMIGGSVTSAVAMPNSGGSSATIGVSGGGSLGSAFVSGGRLDVGSGGVVRAAYLSMGGLGVVNGTVFSANVESGCPLQVSSGGIVSSAAISSGGRINLNQGKLGSAYVAKGGILSVNSGGSVGSGNVYGSAVVSYGLATGLSVRSGGRLTISNWGGVSRCAVYGGTVDIHSAGSFVSCAVSQGGSVTVNRGAFVVRGTVGSGGVVKVSSGVEWFNSYTVLNGGKVTGYYDCKKTTFSSGGIADINIFNTSAGNEKAIVNNLSYATNRGVVFTLTVSASQAKGLYVLADDAAGFNETITVQNIYGDAFGTLKVGQTANIGGVNYRLDLDSDILSVSVGAAAPAGSAKGDIDGNGVSDVLFQYSGGDYQLGYWMNGTNTWRGQGLAKPAEWEVLGSYDMNSNGKADAVLVGNVTTEIGGKGAYIGYYLDSVDTDANWQNIGYLNNEENIAWKNKVGNLTGNSGMNSIVWYAPELYALGVWTDGTTDWLTLSTSFGGNDWTLVGCGDFNGDGKDSVVMNYNNGQFFYVAGLGGAAPRSLGSANWSGWEIRAIGDFKGDGKDDLVLFHNDTGSMVMCADGNVDSYVSIGQLAKGDWFVVGAGDYNGDAKDDLLVRQNSTGMLGYYNAGDVVNGWVELGRGVDMKWTVIA